MITNNTDLTLSQSKNNTKIMKESVFTTIKLYDNREVSISMIKPHHLWRAIERYNQSQDKDIGMSPFIVSELLFINDNRMTIEEIDMLSIDDYIKIVDSTTPMMLNINAMLNDL